MVVLGNEAVFNQYISAPALAAFVRAAKKQLRAAGYHGPVTTTEPLETLRAHAAEVCGSVDVVAANVHPFFNAHVAARDAGVFVAEQLREIAAVCPGLTPYNLETGWPSGGERNGQAVPGEDEQRLAIQAIAREAGGRSAFLSYL